MSLFYRKKGFTLIEIMITVAIIGLLIALAVPNFVRNRRSARDKLCMNNLRLIHHALLEYKIDNDLPSGQDATPIYNGIITGAPDAYIKVEPLTPIENLSYTVTTFDTNPTCPNRDASPADPNYIKHTL